MMRSLWISKTGMEAQQTQLDNISNNLANVSTNGYKRSHAVFEDLMYQNMRQAGAASSDQTELPLSVATGRLPSDTAAGDEVDIWVVPKDEDQSAKLLWAKVRVLQIDSVKGVAGGSARRQVLVALARTDLQLLPAALSAMSTGEPITKKARTVHCLSIVESSLRALGHPAQRGRRLSRPASVKNC